MNIENKSRSLNHETPASIKAKDNLLEDNLRLYLSDISEFSLIDAQREQDLARAIRDKREDKEGQLAWEELTNANLRLVVSIAKKFQGRGLTLEELIQEGNIGLMRAVAKFDPERGFRFSTFATYCIRQSLQKAVLEYSQGYKINDETAKSLRYYKKVKDEYTQLLQRELTNQELAIIIGEDKEWAYDIQRVLEPVVSLDRQLGDDEDDLSLIDLVETKEDGPEEKLMETATQQAIDEVLEILDPRERDIIIKRYGLFGRDRIMDQKDIAKEYKIGRERLSQIEIRAIRKLRRPNCIKRLNELINF